MRQRERRRAHRKGWRSNNTWIGNQVRLKASLYDTSGLIYY